MPQVRPFRPITYAPGDLTNVVCPPYDVIDDALRERLLARDPHNAIRLELPPGEAPHHTAAGALAAWLADGTLARRPAASVFSYAFARPSCRTGRWWAA